MSCVYGFQLMIVMDKFIFMYPVIGDLILKLPDEPHNPPPFPSDTDFLEDRSPYSLQRNITQLLQLSITSGGTDVQEKLTGLFYIHCITHCTGLVTTFCCVL